LLDEMGLSSQSSGALESALGPRHVEELERVPAPAPDEFLRRYVRPRRPAVLTGLTEGWSPPQEWSLETLASRFGSARVVSARLSRGKLLDDPVDGVLFRHVELGGFVASLASQADATDYVMAPTSNFPASFQEHYRIPAYCAHASHLRAKVWLGKGGTVTPLHRDVPHNLHVHLVGRKRWLLFAPSDSSRLYPRGLFSSMPNFSHVDPEHPDNDRYPRFAAARGLGATLNPGETLFIPHGWWHHTRSLDDAVSMNFWWGGPLVQLASLASSAFKRWRGIRQGEWS
jgi:[protein]-arginine 3-hydroxylase / protease